MPYIPTVWTTHVVSNPNTFNLQSADAGLNGKTVTLVANFGSIIQQGTPVSIVNLNKIENALQEVFSKVENLDIVAQGTATIPVDTGSNYTDIGTGAKSLWESDPIPVAGVTILVGNKYDVDTDEAITDSTILDAFTSSEIIKFVRHDDNNIKVRLYKKDKVISGMNIIVTEVKDDGGVV